MVENSRNIRVASMIMLIGLIQFFIFESISTYIYPNYSVSNNYVSDLGVGAASAYFNTSIVVLGIMEIAGAVLLRGYSKALSITFILSGIGAAGVGIVNQDMIYTVHMIFALMAFLFASISSFVVLNRERSAVSVIWAVLGAISLAALILSYPYFNNIYFAIGKGGMERMTMIPNILWAIGFSSSLYTRFGAVTNQK